MHFIVTQEFPGTAFLGRLKRVGLISPRRLVSGYWPERLPHTLVYGQNTNPPFSLSEGEGHARTEESKYGSFQIHLAVVKALRIEKNSQVSVHTLGAWSRYYVGSASRITTNRPRGEARDGGKEYSWR